MIPLAASWFVLAFAFPRQEPVADPTPRVLVLCGLPEGAAGALDALLSDVRQGVVVRAVGDDGLLDALALAKEPVLAIGYPVLLLQAGVERGLLKPRPRAEAVTDRAAGFGWDLDARDGAYVARWLDPLLIVTANGVPPPASVARLASSDYVDRVVCERVLPWSSSGSLLATLALWDDGVSIAAGIRANRQGVPAARAREVIPRVLGLPAGAVGIVPRRALTGSDGSLGATLVMLTGAPGTAPRVAFDVLGIAAGFGVPDALVGRVLETKAALRLAGAARLLALEGEGAAESSDAVGDLMRLADPSGAAPLPDLSGFPRAWVQAWRADAASALRDARALIDRSEGGTRPDEHDATFRASETFDVLAIVVMAAAGALLLWRSRRR